MSRTNIEKFEKWLGSENSGWHECHLDLTSDELQEFSQEDWDYLLAVAPSRPAWWQVRCAEAVGQIDCEQSVRILLALLALPDVFLGSIVASELDNLEVRVPLHYQARLRELLAQLEAQQSNRRDEVRRLLAQLR